jgi:AcrR family transcriptional regulator
MSMAVSYERTGRVRQKARTRDALLTAARRLLAEGTTPTVEDAAAAAAVSRATAYRYFPNQRALLVAAHPEIEARSLLGPDPPDDVAARLDAVVNAILDITLGSESELRTMLRLSLESGVSDDNGLVLRKGRRIRWVEDALSPLRGQLPEDELRRLIHAIAASVGIDVLVWMTDVAGLARDEAVEIMRWSARALLRSALE